MKLAICDDVRKDADETIEIVGQYFSDNNYDADIMYLNPEDLVTSLKESFFEYDIAILDIDYKDKDFNGIDIGKKINENNPLCNIIYVTGVLEFASDVYETEHCYFVLKNNQKITLKRALDKAVNLYKTNNEKKSVSLITGRKNIIIPVWDIHYITRENRRIEFCCGDKIYDSYMSLNDILKQLPDKFVRCHTGYIINLDFIRRVESNSVFMDDDMQIPIGRIYKEKFVLHYLDYLEGRI